MLLHTTSAMLYLDGVSVSFDGFRALNQLSLVIEPGEMHAIIGPNGAADAMMDVIAGKGTSRRRRCLLRRRASRPDEAG